MAESTLAAKFLTEYEITIDFGGRVLTSRRDGEVAKHSFSFERMPMEGDGGELVSIPVRSVRGLPKSSTLDQ
jgi:hypothetical protein